MRAARDGVSIRFEARGEGAPLLVIPGLGLDLHAFEPFAALLERDFTCVLIDNRGAGDSDAPRGPYSVGDLAADAAAVLEASGARPAFVLGHSMGGFTAIELALRSPAVVRGLLLVSTAASGDLERLGQTAEARAALERRSGPPEEIARGNLAACLTPRFLVERPDEFSRLVAGRLAHPPKGRGLSGQRAAAVAFDATSRLGGIRVPAAVVHGDADRVVGIACGRALAASIPGASFHLLEGVGHMPFWEAPEALAAIARRLAARQA